MLDELWPDPDRRDEALLHCLLDVVEHEVLTPMQVRVLQGLSQGLGREGTADLLGVGVETVKTHLKYGQRALGAKDTAHACCEALRQGLIR